MRFNDVYGPERRTSPTEIRAAHSSADRRCRHRVAAEPGTGSWSNHAYGLAVDINPVENPYVGCGMSRDPKAQSLPRPFTPPARVVTPPRVVRAFREAGWGWGGAWSGNAKDYMHFSVNGH